MTDDEVDTYYSNLKGKNIKKNATREEREKLFYYFNNPRVAIFEMCKKNGDWSLIPVDDSVFEEYNEKEGILKDIKFDSIENVDDGYDFGMAKVIVTSVEKRTKYIIEYLLDYEIRNIKIFEKIDLTDENGNDLDTRYKFEGDQIRYNFLTLRYDGQEEEGEIIGSDVAVTDNFRKKYPYFLDLFKHYSPLEYNHIELLDLDVKKQIVIYEVDSVLECKKRTYEVKYKLTDDLYLDDVEVNMINENINQNNKYLMEKTFYKNSDWDNLELSDEFRKKFDKKNGVFPDIDKLSNNFSFNREKLMYDSVIIESVDKKRYQIRKFISDNFCRYYLWNYTDDKNGYLDDIIYKELPYDYSLSIEEVKEKFLADKELQKELGIDFES